MEKIYLYFTLLLTLLMTGCDKKEDNIYTQTPDERLTEVLKEYQDLLLSSPNGWLLTINTEARGCFRFWMAFDEKNRVTMLSDLDYSISTAGATSRVPLESSYRLKGQMAPSLLFDTYNYLHVLADPQGTVNGGTSGAGLVSDFEFSFIKVDNGRIYLRGNFNGSTAYMDPATPEEVEYIAQGGLTANYDCMESYLDHNLYPIVQMGDTKVQVRPGVRSTTFSYMDEQEQIITLSVGSYMDLDAHVKQEQSSSVHFIEPIEVLGTAYSDLMWDEAAGNYTLCGGAEPLAVSDNRVPPYDLKLGYKKTFTTLYTKVDELEGSMSQEFMDNYYTPAYNALKGNTRTIRYVQCQFTSNASSGLPQMELWIRYANSKGSEYIAKWYFSYRENEDGTITFLDREQTGSSNERGQEPYLKKLVDFFCTVEYQSYSTASWAQTVKASVTPHTFYFDWVANNTPGLTSDLGGMYRVEDNGEVNRSLFITGTLK